MLSENRPAQEEERESSPKADNIVELTGITVRHDCNVVLPDITLGVRRGEFLAISGPNGGGKTTLLRVMLKLMKPDAGKVQYFDSQRRPTKNLAIGYLPQKSNIDTKFPLTTADVIASGLLRGLRHRMNDADRRRFSEITEMMGVEAYLDRSIGALSGGQLQRTLLGRALISRPELLVLDEPLSYVDKTFEHQIYAIMEKVAKETTIVLVSHEMSVISGMATRHLIVDHGLHECPRHNHAGTQC